LVHEAAKYHISGASHDFEKYKESVFERVPEAKVQVIVHHKTKGD